MLCGVYIYGGYKYDSSIAIYIGIGYLLMHKTFNS
jgi:hypothetical protein